ncbi:SHOCT domain-containing protein [Salipaludibacillus sp. HK11]|uniref:SHOCT domain-containing protein n=1 Tax=Salipaludibacillus sp. HK11 TaxID=3394320 RepID=UPI0039FC7AF3
MHVTKITEKQSPLTNSDRKPLSLEQLQREFDYHRAEKLLRKMLEKELLSDEEFFKIMLLNRKSFSPLLAQLMPDKP